MEEQYLKGKIMTEQVTILMRKFDGGGAHVADTLGVDGFNVDEWYNSELLDDIRNGAFIKVTFEGQLSGREFVGEIVEVEEVEY